MSINQKIDTLISRFTKIEDWEQRYKELIRFGKELNQLDESEWEDRFKVKGCQSQVWLKPTYKDGKVVFRAASDAVIVRGIVALLVNIYSDEEPDLILANPPEFLKEIGITEHLSMNRTNGLAAMAKQIQMYAVVFKSLKDKGILNADQF